MGVKAARVTAYAALPALYVLHNDLWFWSDPNRFLGLPVGLSYHVLFTAAVVFVMWRLVRVAWPGELLVQLAGEADDDCSDGATDAETAEGSATAGKEDER